jgi:amino acid adenylation domain-containing protein
VDDTARCVAALPEQQRLLWARCVHPTGTFVAFPRVDVERTIPERFERQVSLHAERLAIKVGPQRWSYQTLNALANRIAWAILGTQQAHTTPVALLFEQGPQAIAGMLGALKAGHPYVPLDPTHPPARLAFIIEDSQPVLLLTSAQHAPLARTLLPSSGRILLVDQLPETLSTENPGCAVRPDALACLIYTSGSTGQPKGVMHTHRTILHMIMTRTNTLHICADDRLTLLYSPGVIGALRSIFLALLNGAALFPRHLSETGLTNLAAWLQEEGITFFRSVPVVFRQLMGSLRGEDTFPTLRLVWVGGDVLDPQDVALYKQSLPDHCVFVHGFGATETGIHVLHFIDKATLLSEGRVPLGYPVDEARILVLDDDGTEVPDGEVGEIAIRSSYLALGYWRQPALTQAAFHDDVDGNQRRMYRTGDIGRRLPDGCLEHWGRKHWYVKIRGHRVALGEVEHALHAMPAIAEAAVVPWDDPTGDTRLVAYIVTAQPSLAPGDIRSFIQARLPAYMVPAIFTTIDVLPRTPNGKVDRRNLPPPMPSRRALPTLFAPPRTPIEEHLVALWSTVLGLDQVGVHDHFLDLGGDSLHAMRIVSRVQEMWQAEIQPSLLFETPTVADMAVLVTAYLVAKTEPAAIEMIIKDIESTSSESA